MPDRLPLVKPDLSNISGSLVDYSGSESESDHGNSDEDSLISDSISISRTSTLGFGSHFATRLEGVNVIQQKPASFNSNRYIPTSSHSSSLPTQTTVRRQPQLLTSASDNTNNNSKKRPLPAWLTEERDFKRPPARLYDIYSVSTSSKEEKKVEEPSPNLDKKTVKYFYNEYQTSDSQQTIDKERKEMYASISQKAAFESSSTTTAVNSVESSCQKAGTKGGSEPITDDQLSALAQNVKALKIELSEAESELNSEQQRAIKIREELEKGIQDFVNPESSSATSTNVIARIDRYSPEWFIDRAKYVPVRLSYEERKMMRLVEAALSVSDYTTRIDNLTHKNDAKRSHAQMQEIFAALTGIAMAVDYEKAQGLLRERNFCDYDQFFQKIFEVARRYKIMNPEKMRSEYGKMMFLLQDTTLPDIKDALGFSVVQEISTVYSLFEKCDCLDALRHPDMKYATQQVTAEGKSRHQVQRQIKEKERALETISRKYANHNISRDDIKQGLYSIGDNHAYLLGNKDPVDKMLKYLKSNFDPASGEGTTCLAISGGVGGSRLTHSHSRQYNFVHQSLTLWRDIADDMFKLWSLAEQDLLDAENPYQLRDTGQGIHRVQQCPRTDKAMRQILYRCQQEMGSWVGSSVIHLGDTNVPNALMFIDKYAQVSRILYPVCQVLGEIKKLSEDKANIQYYITTAFGSIDNLKMAILSDFFTHAFDGSGADNFFDAGSCIDGRLTSAWNWCNSLDSKPYYHIFNLCGFTGFDGEV
eukprot:UC4_evm1s1496